MSEVTVDANGEVLLDAAIESGVNIPFGCRNAKCGVCQVEVISGELVVAGELENATLEAFRCASGVRLACQAKTNGLVVVRPVQS
ncbi:MAG: hypothetical protein COB96_05055 [Planctomycetota bacterium]|jgi:ferredoxin|nr:MAG: hypothetical protein COB96_05055 [Planctomycetota bacterium]